MKKRIIYTGEMARDLWNTTTDKAIKALCIDAIYRQDMRARADVLRLYKRLEKETNQHGHPGQ